eukprot:UN04294
MNTGECRVRFRVKGIVIQNIKQAYLEKRKRDTQATYNPLTSKPQRPLHIYTLLNLDNQIDRSWAIKQVNNELTSLCSNFGADHDAMTGCLVSKGNFVLTAGHDRIIRYWDIKIVQNQNVYVDLTTIIVLYIPKNKFYRGIAL